MSAQRAESADAQGWAPGPGERVVLRLDPNGAGLAVRIAPRRVVPARETRVEKMLRRPTIWGGALASLAVFVLVSTAFATGTVRPAPPTVPTPRPGEPTPTPDTRPALSIGGFVLQPPVRPTPVLPTPSPSDADEAPQAGLQFDDNDTAQPTASPADEPTPGPCTNLFGLACAAPPRVPPARLLPRGQAPQPARPSTTNPPVVPIASPAAQSDRLLDELQTANVGPPRGSPLDSALQAASAADQNFAREVEPGRQGAATSPDDTPPEPSSASSRK
jgi:hypothetical protein